MFAYCHWCRKSLSPSTAGLWWPALFPVRHSKREKKGKGKCAYCLKVPTFPDWSQGTATLHSCEEWSDPIQGRNKESTFWKIQMLSWAEKSDSSFRRVLSRDQRRLCTGRCLVDSTIMKKQEENKTFLKSSRWGRWSQTWHYCRLGLRQEG